MRIAILDDYQGVATQLADWSVLGPDAALTVFREPLPQGAARIAVLQPFEVIVAMRERTPFPASLIRALPALRLLVTTGLRNNAIAVQACREQGVVVSGAPGSATANTATAELAWAHILALFKHLPAENAAMRRGLWQTGMPVPLAGRCLGVVGLGKLGSAVAQVGKAFGMEVLAWSPNLTPERAAQAGVTAVDKQTLFARADVVSLHLILSETTQHVVDAPTLAAMKPGAYLVNTARAGLVDTAALTETLRQGRIAGAGLDVFESEPLAADDPLRTLDNVVLTPHLGYVSHDNFQAFYKNAVLAVQAWREGAPIQVLNAG